MLPGRRSVYSTDRESRCPKCGWPLGDCHCSAALAPDEKVPARVRATLRLEKRASGRSVTVIDGLPKNRQYLDELARQLKKACGTGGGAGEGFIEIQGDQRERLRDLLARRGLAVKG